MISFAWEAYYVRVSTVDGLKRREWCCAHKCFLCLEEEDIIDHVVPIWCALDTSPCR